VFLASERHSFRSKLVDAKRTAEDIDQRGEGSARSLNNFGKVGKLGRREGNRDGCVFEITSTRRIDIYWTKLIAARAVTRNPPPDTTNFMIEKNCFSFPGAAAASRVYVDALSRLARQAQLGTWGGSKDVGKWKSFIGSAIERCEPTPNNNLHAWSTFKITSKPSQSSLSSRVFGAGREIHF